MFHCLLEPLKCNQALLPSIFTVWWLLQIVTSQHLSWYDKSLKFRQRVFSSVLLALLCDWSENSLHHLSETDTTPIPIVTFLHWFSRASGSSIDFTFRFHRPLMMPSFVLSGRNYFNIIQLIWVLTNSTHQVKFRGWVGSIGHYKVYRHEFLTLTA